MAEVTITTANFEEEVLKSEIPVLVDFWATW
ncbi:MAG: thioredoxin, partial [Lachnospiraceae bacterium]|nr:thioredoxin [Lachnospiraceae bacterium]